jgi:polysaccharide biosynthesis protein PslH
MRILFLSNWYPYPPNNGSKLRINNMLKALKQHHQVTLISFSDNGKAKQSGQKETTGEEIRIIPNRSYNPTSKRALLGYLSTKPRVLVDRYAPEMADAIHDEVKKNHYDLVIASQWYMAAYQHLYREYPAIFDEVEVGVFADKVDQAKSLLSKTRHKLTVLKMSWYLRNILSHFRMCTVVSEPERNLIKRMVPDYASMEIIPNGINLADYIGVKEELKPASLTFCGSFHYRPNYDAMLWFVKNVFPIIREAVPEASLTITGDHGNLPFPKMEGVKLRGFVEDVHPIVASSWVNLAPIHMGGGTRIKILEAMALRSPVVATTKGAEGLEIKDGEHLLMADTPADYAEAVISLIKEPELRHRITDNAYDLVRQKYDWRVIAPKFLSLVEKVARN